MVVVVEAKAAAVAARSSPARYHNGLISSRLVLSFTLSLLIRPSLSKDEKWRELSKRTAAGSCSGGPAA